MNTKRTFRVEAHSASILAVSGGGRYSYGYAHAPLLTREEAWAEVKRYAADAVNAYHTIKVFDGGKMVCRVWRQSNGSHYLPDQDRAL